MPRRKPSTQPQGQSPQSEPQLVVSSGFVATDVSNTERGYAQRLLAESDGQPRPIGERNVNQHVPKPPAQPGGANIREHRPPGSVQDTVFRPTTTRPIIRDHHPTGSNFRPVRGHMADQAQRFPQAPPPPQYTQAPTQLQPNPPPPAAPQRIASSPITINPNAAPADVTVFITVAMRPTLLRAQLEAIFSGSVVPMYTWAWINNDGSVPTDFSALESVRAMMLRTNGNLGGWPRIDSAPSIGSRYLLILDDDCVPGPDWLRFAIERLEAAERDEEGELIITVEGHVFDADDPTSLSQTGSETEDVECDVGARGWLGHTYAFAALNSALQRAVNLGGFGLYLGAAAAMAGVRTIKLPTPMDKPNLWGVTSEAARPSLSTAAQDYAKEYAQAYSFYREQGWLPLVASVGGETQHPEPSQPETVSS